MKNKAKSSRVTRKSKSSATKQGPFTLNVQKKGGAIHAITVRIAPHHVVTFTGGAKPTVSMACTHHGFVAESFELNGQLEQVINHVRKHFPELRAD